MTDKKIFRLSNLLKFLEDPEHPSVGPHLRLMSFIGLWHPDLKSRTAKFKQYLFYVVTVFFFSQFFKCIIKFKISNLMLILKYVPFHMGIVKACFFQKDYKKWVNLIAYISNIERKQIVAGDKKINSIIDDYVLWGRRITYCFWSMAFFSNLTLFSEPYQHNYTDVNGTKIYFKMFDGYTPFSDDSKGYYMAMFIQTVFGYVVSVYIVGWDTLICTIMIFFAGQLKVSRLTCSRAINVRDNQRSHKNVADCHQFHNTLVKNQQLFNALISPVMSIYLVIISVNLGVCITQLAQIQKDLTSMLPICLYVNACLIQLLLFYWHSNEVTESSLLVSYGIYESNWYEVNNKYQREVALLGITTNKRLVFKVGICNEMSLKTFISILRTSYSFYTLLNETK